MSLTTRASFCDGALGRGVSVRQAVTMVMVGKGLEDAALSGEAFHAACFHEAGKLVPQDGQTSHFGLDLGELRDRQGMGVAARTLGMGG